MDDDIKLGRVAGIPIGVSWTILGIAALFMLVLIFSVLPTYAPDADLAVRSGVAALGVVAFFASIVAHELGHALVAQAHGIRVEGITLWLLGGVARLNRQPSTARSEMQIAVAGPAVSAALGLLFAGLTIIASSITTQREVLTILGWLAGVNLTLALFNLFPAAPLDGGRALTALLWWSSADPHRARIIAGRAGLILGVALGLFGLGQIWFGAPSGMLTVLVAGFIFQAARAEITSAALRTRLDGLTVGDAAAPRQPALFDWLSAQQLLERVPSQYHHCAIPVVRWDHNPIGYVVASRALALPEPVRSRTPIGALTTPVEQLVTVGSDQLIDGFIARWIKIDDLIVIVTEPDSGALVGTICHHQLQTLAIKPGLWGRQPTEPPAITMAEASS